MPPTTTKSTSTTAPSTATSSACARSSSRSVTTSIRLRHFMVSVTASRRRKSRLTGAHGTLAVYGQEEKRNSGALRIHPRPHRDEESSQGRTQGGTQGGTRPHQEDAGRTHENSQQP